MESLLTDMATVFVLVLARVGALITTAPIVSETTIPMRIKSLLAVMMAAVMTPLCLHHPAPEMANIAELGAAIGAEVIIGIALGLGVMLILAGVQLTGQIVGQLSGMAMAEGADPAFGSNASIFGQIFYVRYNRRIRRRWRPHAAHRVAPQDLRSHTARLRHLQPGSRP